MAQVSHIFSHFALGLALCGLALAAVCALAAYALKRARRSRSAAVAVFLLGAVVAAIYADKPTPTPSATIMWDSGLTDNGSIATNDTVFIRGTFDPLMATDALHVDYRDKGSTNALDCVRTYNGTVSDLTLGFTVTISNATNRIVYVWSEYVPPSPVHTNGEYRIINVGTVTNSPPESPRYVVTRTPIKGMDELGGETRLSPPTND